MGDPHRDDRARRGLVGALEGEAGDVAAEYPAGLPRPGARFAKPFGLDNRLKTRAAPGVRELAIARRTPYWAKQARASASEKLFSTAQARSESNDSGYCDATSALVPAREGF